MSGRVPISVVGAVALALLSGCLFVLPSFGQDGSGPGRAGSATAGPDVYVLEDKDGRLYKQLGITYEEFVERERQRVVGGGRPEYAFDRFQVQGKVESDRVDMDVQVEISLLTGGPGEWVRIPLRLDGVIVQEAPLYTGDGEAHVVPNERRELELWLRGNHEAKHSVHLKVLSPLASAGDRRSLQLLAPRATQSEMTLVFPTPITLPEASDGVRVEMIDGDDADADPVRGRQVRFRGLGGDVRVSWRADDVDTIVEPRALDVEGRQRVEIHDWHIRVLADLRVASRGQAFDRFDVTLPPGFQLVSGRHGRYRVEQLNSKAAPGKPQQVRVVLEQMTPGPIEVQLVAERSYDVVPSGARVPLAGFQVGGAVRQGGHIAMAVDEGRRVMAIAQENVGRVDDLPESLQADDVVAGFEYFRQPYQLEVTITPPVARVSVEPQYTFDVSQGEVALTGRLNYRVMGANVHDLVVDLAGWQVDTDAGVSAGNVRMDEAEQDAQGRLRIPLAAGGMKGDFEIEFRASKKIEVNASSVRFSLPRPQDDLRGVATVIVLSADNIQLVPRREGLIGLTPLRIAPDINIPSRQQKPFFYGTEEKRAEFFGDYQIRDRVVEVEIDSLVNLWERTVEQTLRYEVAYEPIGSLSLFVPREFLEDGRVRAVLDGDALEMMQLRESTAEEKSVLVGATLAEPLIGSFRLQVRGQLANNAIENVSDSLEEKLTVPLVLPVDGTLGGNRLRLLGGENVEVDLEDDQWTEATGPRQPGEEATAREYRRKEATSSVDLTLRIVENAANTAVLVRRAWIRSWLAGNERRDWATYRVRCRDSSLKIELPVTTDPGKVHVYVDGRRQEVPPLQQNDASRLVLELAVPDKRDREYTLDLQYSIESDERNLVRTMQTPRFELDAGIEDMAYHEILVPASKHLLRTPPGMTASWRWQWETLRWNRIPLMSAQELATWSSSAVDAKQYQHIEALVQSDQVSRYLFSSMSIGDTFEVSFTSRATATLVGAGAVLVAGIALLYLPWVRRPGVLLLLSVGLLAIGLIYPQPTLILAQAGVLGMLLVLLAFLLKHLLRGRPAASLHVPASSGSSARLRTTEFHFATASQGMSSQRTSVAAAPASSFAQQEAAPSKT